MIDANLNLFGEWNIEIVDSKSGNSYFPFGKSFKKNKLLRRGIEILLKANYTKTAGDGYGGFFNFQTVPAFLSGGAGIGGGKRMVLFEDIGLHQSLQESGTLLSEHREYFCKYEDNTSNGSRSYIKIYDFTEVGEGISISEAGIYNINQTTNEKTYFSRFLFPEEIILGAGQWIRLSYKFTVTVNAIVSPINVSIGASPGGAFNPSGQIKLVGKFDDIFGPMNSVGDPFLIIGDSARQSFVPYCETFFDVPSSADSKIIPTAYMLWDNVDFPNVDTRLTTEWVGDRLSPDSLTVIVSPYEDGTLYRDITYIFNMGNPLATSSVGGILFTNTRVSNSIAGISSDRNNTWDGWLWKFDTPQTKIYNKKITITIRVRVNS